MPKSYSRPKWAAYAMFHLSLDRSDLVEEISVEAFDAKTRFEIADSISQRFGTPFDIELRREDLSWAKWESGEAFVEMFCQTRCRVTFRTPAAQARHDAELAARRKKEAARPKAP